MSRFRLAAIGLAGLGIVLAVVLSDRSVSSNSLERRSEDVRVAIERAMFEVDWPQVAIVAIDQTTLDGTRETWPWPRALVARLLEKIGQARPCAVGVLLPGMPTAPGLDPIQDVLSHTPEVCFGCDSSSVPGGGVPPIALPDAAARGGVIGFSPDEDGVVRRFMLQVDSGGSSVASLPLMLFRIATAQPGGWPAGFSAQDYETPIQFAGPPGTIPRVSAGRVLEGLDANLLQGKVLILGNTVGSEGQAYPTPFSELPGGRGTTMQSPEILANCVATTLGMPGFRRFDGAARTGLLVGVALLGWLLFVFLRPATGLALAIFLVFIYTVGVLAASVYHQQLLPLVLPLAALIVGYVASLMLKGLMATLRL